MAKRKVGRKPNIPNLKKVDGGVINRHGVFFTYEQKKALERAVDKSNRMSKKELAAWEFDHKDISRDHTQLKLMGSTPDYIVSHQNRTLQRFESMQEYDRFMRKQKRIHSGEYRRDKIRLYKRNFIGALKDTYNGEDMDDIIHKIHWMNPIDYMKMVSDNEVLSITFVPSHQRVSGRLNQIREALGLKVKDDWPDEEI